MRVLVSLSLLFMFSSNVLAFGGYAKRIKSHMGKMLGIEDEKESSRQIKLPEIPSVVADAKDSSIYKKHHVIYKQGKAFDKLSIDKKKSYRVAFLRELYFETKQKDATNDELGKALNVLEQNGTREGVYRSIVLGQEYAKLERHQEFIQEKLVSFVLNYGEKFLAKSFNNESLSKLNLWNVKRIITEKSLELVDELAKNPDTLYKWYTVLSTDFAEQYPDVWNQKVRKSVNEFYHYKWVQKVPLQHIKSELIVKLHRLMNKLHSYSKKD